MIYKYIIYTILIFFILGAIGSAYNSKLRLAEEFQRGFAIGGRLLILMSGYVCLAPVLVKFLRPSLGLFATVSKADPSLLPCLLFPCDSGGAPIAAELAASKSLGLFNGYIVASVIGPTVMFTIPISLAAVSSLTEKKLVIYGLLAGIITAPLGMFAGGLVAGFTSAMMLHDLLPVLLFMLILLICLLKFSEATLRSFIFLGKLGTCLAYLGLAAAAVEKLSGLAVIPGMVPIDEAFRIIGGITLILAGIFPALAVLTYFLSGTFNYIADLMKIKIQAVSGFLLTMANSIATFGMLKDMDDKGKMLNAAFSVGAAWVLGDHLGYTAQTKPLMLVPMIVAKLMAGITAVIVANLLYKIVQKKQK